MNQQSFAEFYAKHIGELVSFCKNSLRVSDPEELVQQMFVNLISKEQEDLTIPFCKTALKNLRIDWIRSSNTRALALKQHFSSSEAKQENSSADQKMQTKEDLTKTINAAAFSKAQVIALLFYLSSLSREQSKQMMLDLYSKNYDSCLNKAKKKLRLSLDTNNANLDLTRGIELSELLSNALFLHLVVLEISEAGFDDVELFRLNNGFTGASKTESLDSFLARESETPNVEKNKIKNIMSKYRRVLRTFSCTHVLSTSIIVAATSSLLAK